MNWLVSTSLRLRVIVVALAVALMIIGVRVIRSTPLDVFPEFAPPLVEIQTEAPGLSTAEVESLISTPIENALNGVAQLKTLRSKSVLGLSSVVLAGAATGAGAAGAGRAAITGRCETARDFATALVDEPRHEDRRVFENALAGGAFDAGALDDPPATDGHSRRGERGDLGTA
jgi:hypothetical protein